MKKYSELLKDGRWQIRKTDIMTRDDFCCQLCGKSASEGVTLNVHHIKYRKGAMPWEYGNEELVTLCEDCHNEVHRNNIDLVKQDNNIRFDLSEFSLQVGDFIAYEHSDYDNSGIVYYVDQKKGVVKSVTIDNGSGAYGMWFDEIDLYDMTTNRHPVSKMDGIHYNEEEYVIDTGEIFDEFEYFGLVADFFYHVWNDDRLENYSIYGNYGDFEAKEELENISKNFDLILSNNEDIERFVKDKYHL